MLNSNSLNYLFGHFALNYELFSGGNISHIGHTGSRDARAAGVGGRPTSLHVRLLTDVLFSAAEQKLVCIV